jgi:hypothetical protein
MASRLSTWPKASSPPALPPDVRVEQRDPRRLVERVVGEGVVERPARRWPSYFES